MLRRLIILVAASVAAGCGDSTAPRQNQTSLAGVWSISDTFGLSGTITLADSSIQTLPLADSTARWAQQGEHIAVDGFAMGSGTLNVKGSLRPASYCGAMLYRTWPFAAGIGVPIDTVESIRFQCGGVTVSANKAPRLPSYTSLALSLESAPIRGLADTTSTLCKPNSNTTTLCESPYVGLTVTLTRTTP